MENLEPNTITVVPSPKTPGPVQDEWGIFDPERAGLEAVLRRLADKEENAAPTGTSLAPRNAAVRSR